MGPPPYFSPTDVGLQRSINPTISTLRLWSIPQPRSTAMKIFITSAIMLHHKSIPTQNKPIPSISISAHVENNLAKNYGATSTFGFPGSSSAIDINFHHTPCINAKPMPVCKLVDPLTLTHPLSWQLWELAACHEDVHVPLTDIVFHGERHNVSFITSISIY